MNDTNEITDTEIREKLISYGFPSPPVTRTTRVTLLNKLKRLEASERNTCAVTDSSAVDGVNLNSSESSIFSTTPVRSTASTPVMRSTPLGNYTRTSIRNRGTTLPPKVYVPPLPNNSRHGSIKKHSKWSRLYSAFTLLAAVISFAVITYIFLSNPKTPLQLLQDVKYPLCGSDENQDGCVPERQLSILKTHFRLTVEKLVNIAERASCNVKSENVTIKYNNLIDFLIDEEELLKFEAERFVSYIKVILKHNNFLGIRVSKEALIYEDPPLPIYCIIVSYANSAITYAFRFLLGIILLTAGYLVYVWYIAKYSSHRREVNRLVNLVIELLRQNALTNPVNSYLPMDHVRDQLIPPEQRQAKRKVWHEVVNQIKNTESRIREEVQLISGEDFLVWKWLPIEKSFIK